MINEDSTNAYGSRYQDTYTNYLLNKKPTRRTAIIINFFIGMLNGMIQGYTRSVVLSIHEAGASYAQQSYFNIIFYPNMYKFIIAPIIDIYFIGTIGKAKTYIVSSGVILSSLIAYVSLNVDDMINTNDVSSLTFYLFIIMQVYVVYQCAGDILISDNIEKEDLPRVVQAKEIGCSIGDLLGFNIFLPLNSPSFLNKTYLGNLYDIKEPIVTHKMFLFAYSITHISIVVVILVLYGERNTYNFKRPTFTQIIKVLPQFLSNDSIRGLLIYLLINRGFRSAVSITLTLKLMDHGFSKASMSTTETIAFPIVTIIAIYIYRRKSSERPALMNHKMTIVLTFIYAFKFLILLDLQKNENKIRTFILLACLSAAEKTAARASYFSTFLYSISTKEVSSTYIALFSSWINATLTLPSSVGLFLTSDGISEYYPYDWFVISFLSIQIVSMVLSYRYASCLDEVDRNKFSVTIDDEKHSQEIRLLG